MLTPLKLCSLRSLRMNLEQIEKQIRSVPDFPKKGVVYKDITPVLESAEAFSSLVEMMRKSVESLDVQRIVGIESRGFILGAALAYSMNCGLSLVRKAGKLPSKTIQETYELEYGSDQVEIHEGALPPNQRVLIVDDVLATGGTASAAQRLCRKSDAHVVGVSVFIELGFLGGAEKLEKTPVFSVLKYS